MKNPNPEKPPKLMLEDHRLERRYSVLEIATLAAVCRGETTNERIEDAIRLLSAVEGTASKSALEKLRKTIRDKCISRGDMKESTPERIESKIRVLDGIHAEWKKWKGIIDAAERDEKTGKIIRSSLVHEICKAANVANKTNTSGHANRLYRKWLQSALDEAATGGEAVSFEEYQSGFESRSKVCLIHDDDSAWFIVVDLLCWLEVRPTNEVPEIIQSQKDDSKGQIVSPKNRGAGRAEDGKFSAP
jgi:hypothetical protein